MSTAVIAASSSPAVPSPSELWGHVDPAPWSAVLGRYDEAVEVAACSSKSKAGLKELDSWYRTELPQALQTSTSDTEPHVTRDQLARLVEWKMARGQWRPNLLKFAREQPDGVVEAASQKALALLRRSAAAGKAAAGSGGTDSGALRVAVEALVVLKGVGPATASALLAAADPSIPYMGDEAMSVVLPQSRKSDYSLKCFLEVAALLQGKARQLQGALAGVPATEEDSAGEPSSEAARQCQGSDARPPGPRQGGAWTASTVERCLWAAGVLQSTAKSGAASNSSGSAKRARR